MTALQQFNQTFNYHIENPSLEILSMMIELCELRGRLDIQNELENLKIDKLLEGEAK